MIIKYCVLLYFTVFYCNLLFADNDTQWVLDLESKAYEQAKSDTDLQKSIHDINKQVKQEMKVLAVEDFGINITKNINNISSTNKTVSFHMALSTFVLSHFANVLQKGTLLIFVSSSIPYDTLHNYIMRANALNRIENKSLQIRFVLRGIVNNNISEIKPTLNFVHRLLCGKNDTLQIGNVVNMSNFKLEQDNCMQVEVDINPMLFSLFNVTRTPTILYTAGSYEDITDMSRFVNVNSSFANVSFDYWVWIGDLDLFYILEQIDKSISK